MLVVRRDYSSYFNWLKIFPQNKLPQKIHCKCYKIQLLPPCPWSCFWTVWIFHQVLKDFSICAVFWLCSIFYVYYAFLLYNLMFGAVITINWFQSKRCWIFIIYSNHFSGLTGYCNIFECCIVLYSFFFWIFFFHWFPLYGWKY